MVKRNNDVQAFLRIIWNINLTNLGFGLFSVISCNQVNILYSDISHFFQFKSTECYQKFCCKLNTNIF